MYICEGQQGFETNCLPRDQCMQNYDTFKSQTIEKQLSRGIASTASAVLVT